MQKDDMIYRQDALDALANYIHNVDKVFSTGMMSADDCKDAAHSVLDDLPTVQPQRMRGRWVLDNPDFWMCDKCGKWIDILQGDADMNYCPNCGADMRGGDTE